MRLLLLTGPGGAGTTTVAAATAVRAARRGVKTLLLTPEPGGRRPPFDRVRGEVEPGLVLRTADARARSERAWAAAEGPVTRALAALGVDPVEAPEFTGLPGLDDLVTLFEIRDAAAAGWDLVVVDAPALARTVRLLALPAAAVRTVERAVPLERRMLWAMGHVGPASADAPPRGLVEAIEALQAELAGVRDVLAAPGTSVRLVVPVDAAAVEPVADAWTALALHGIAVDGVVLTGFVPAGDHPWLRERAAAQSAAAADAETVFAPLPVVRVPEHAVPPTGPDELAALEVDGLPEAVPPSPRVERDGDGFTFVLPLPRARRGDLELARRGDELVVGVAGERRVLTLPSALRRCDVVGAALRDGALRVAFRPDPDLWRSM